MASFDITSKTMDGMGPHGTKVGLLRVLGPAHVWALGVGIVLVGEYMGWNFAVGKGGAMTPRLADACKKVRFSTTTPIWSPPLS